MSEKMESGQILVFKGINWKLVGDDKWVEHCVSYIANSHEKFVGTRKINGNPYRVFQLCNGDFGAQRVVDSDLVL